MKRRIECGDFQGRLSADSLEATQEAGRSLLASGWVWFLGACSLAAWSFIYVVVSWAAR